MTQEIPGLFRELNAEEEEQFRQHARDTDPPSGDWTLYHPVCRDEWRKRGLVPGSVVMDERARNAFDAVSGAMYYGTAFRSWLTQNPDALAAMETLEHLLQDPNCPVPGVERGKSPEHEILVRWGTY